MKKNRLVLLPIVILSLLLMTSCSSFNGLLAFFNFGSSEEDVKTSDKEDSDKTNNFSEGDLNMNETFVMRAEIENIEDKITVKVYESEYADGTYLIIYGESTVFSTSDASSISVSDLKAGDKIEITYNGQVMMSYPPQVAAIEIKKL